MHDWLWIYEVPAQVLAWKQKDFQTKKFLFGLQAYFRFYNNSIYDEIMMTIYPRVVDYFSPGKGARLAENTKTSSPSLRIYIN